MLLQTIIPDQHINWYQGIAEILG